MTFWILASLVALSVALLLALVLLRSRPSSEEPAAAYDLRVYKAQLAEVDRDLARGVVAADDADRLRTEIARRILAADGQLRAAKAGMAQPKSLSAVTAVGIAVVLVGGAAVLYAQLGAPGYGDLSLHDRIAAAEDRAQNRPSQAEAEADQLPRPAPEVNADYLNLVRQLRSAMESRSDDPRGFELLSEHEANLGNFKDAYEAKARFVALQKEDATASDYVDLAELMALAAGGYISPEAEKHLRQALVLDPSNGTGRYYFGLLLGQIGRPDQGFRIWAETLRIGPLQAPWNTRIRAQIPEMAALAGVNYTPPEIPEPRGPSSEDIEAAQEMSVDDRMDMIHGMVQQLSDRLASEGGPAPDWARLISSLGVLGETDQAAAIYGEAKEMFKTDAEAMALLRAAAQSAGIAK